ncbi:hypothetical protein [Sulfitobacter sp. JB4-11]|uniref:hypothetical protein n=1 Tax=Sulfitobacter rhodophyticola TaxID=3238304 RepID=UPI003511BF5C
MDKATNEECAHPDTTFRAAGIAACTGLAAYRGRYPGLPAHLGLLDDPTGLCHRSFGCQTAWTVTIDAFEKAKMTKILAPHQACPLDARGSVARLTGLKNQPWHQLAVPAFTVLFMLFLLMKISESFRKAACVKSTRDVRPTRSWRRFL